MKLLEVRAHRVGCSTRVARFDHTQDVIVTVVLARAKRGFDVLSFAIKRVQDIEVEVETALSIAANTVWCAAAAIAR